jgi:hypothetical protein
MVLNSAKMRLNYFFSEMVHHSFENNHYKEALS